MALHALRLAQGHVLLAKGVPVGRVEGRNARIAVTLTRGVEFPVLMMSDAPDEATLVRWRECDVSMRVYRDDQLFMQTHVLGKDLRFTGRIRPEFPQGDGVALVELYKEGEWCVNQQTRFLVELEFLRNPPLGAVFYVDYRILGKHCRAGGNVIPE